MKKPNGIILLLLLIFPFTILDSSAQNVKEKDWDGWHFNASPYFWFIGLNGTITVPPAPGDFSQPEEKQIDIDIGFKDISNSIKYAMMFSGQYRNEKISVILNYSHLILQGEAITPLEFVIQGIDTRFRHVSGDLSVQYRLVKTTKWNIDAGVGLKILSEKAEAVVNLPLDLEFDLDRSESWVDLMISTLIKYIPHPKVELAAYGDFGSGLIGDLSYQTISGATFRFTPLFYFSAGYRVWGVKSEKDNVVFKGNINGWITRIGFRF